MHKEVLSKEQIKVLPLLKEFSGEFGMVGGTAIALFMGHRESVDFDLFSVKEFDNLNIKRKISKYFPIERIITDENSQYTIVVAGVKITFLYYPFSINFSNNFDDIIKMPDLLTLAAMKAYVLGRRVKWKDYVDLYFILKDHYSFAEIVKKAKDIFGNEFNEKIFRTQLAYFDDIDYSEKIIWKKNFEISEDIIKKKLIEFSLS